MQCAGDHPAIAPVVAGPRRHEHPGSKQVGVAIRQHAATARPALSMRVASSMPALMARWSQALDCSGVRTGMEGIGER